MKWSMLIIAMKNLAVIAVLYLGLALLLPGCATPGLGFRLCPDFRPSCVLSVSEPGTYIVTYLDANGTQQTANVTTQGTVIVVCDCNLILGAPVRVGGLPVDLSVSNTGSPDQVVVGNKLTYTITVHNDGPFDATDGVSLTDLLQPELNFVSATSSQATCSYDASSRKLTCEIATLRAHTSFSVTLITEVALPPLDGSTKNTALVDLKFSPNPVNYDPTTANNADTATTRVANPAPSANLSITKTDSPDPVTVENNLTYTITVKNSGPSTATGVTLTDTLPSNVAFVSATASQGSCTQSGRTVTCDLGSLIDPATPVCPDCAIVTIVVRPTSVGTITNTAIVTANENDPNTADNVATATTTVTQPALPADLSVTISASPDPVAVGEIVSYTITVTNNGPGSATNVLLTDTLPPAVNLFFFDLPCSPSGFPVNIVTCNLGTLANGASTTIGLGVAPLQDLGLMTNTVSVAAFESDPNTANNTATATTTVNPSTSVDLAVTITDNPDPVVRNGTLTYTISVTNNSTTAATGVTLSDEVARAQPGSVTLSQGSFTQSNLNLTIITTCNFGTLAGGATATATIVVFPVRTGTLTNSANATANESDPNISNNSATEVTTVN
jgi:uncharacterized repeat protein (TIGR01451 family)